MNLLRFLALVIFTLGVSERVEAQELPSLAISESALSLSLNNEPLQLDQTQQLQVLPRFTDEELTRRRRRRTTVGTFFCTAIGAPLSLFMLSLEREDEIGRPQPYTADLVALSLFVQTLISFGGVVAGFKVARRNGGLGPFWAGLLGWFAGTATAALIATIIGATTGEYRTAGIVGVPLLAVFQTTGIVMALEWAHRGRATTRDSGVAVNVGPGSLRVTW